MDEYLRVTDEIISKSKSYNKLMDNFRQNWESPFTYLIKRGYIPAEAKPNNLSCNAIRQMQMQYAENPENAGQSMDSENIKMETNINRNGLSMLHTKDIRRNIDMEKVCNISTEATPEAIPEKTTTVKSTTNDDFNPDDNECEEYYEDVTECYYYDDENDNKTETTTASNTFESDNTESTTKCAPKVETTTEKKPSALPKCKPPATAENPFQKKHFNEGKVIPYKFQFNRLPNQNSQKEQRKIEIQKPEQNKDDNISHEGALRAALQLAQKIAENTVAEYSKNRSQVANAKSQTSTIKKIKRAEDFKGPFNAKQNTQFVKSAEPLLYAQIMPLIPSKNAQKNQEANWHLPMVQVWHAGHPHVIRPNSYPYASIPKTPTPIDPNLVQPDHKGEKSIVQGTNPIRPLPTQHSHLQDKTVHQPESPAVPLLTQLNRLQDKTINQLLGPVRPLLPQPNISPDKHIDQAAHPGHPKPTQPSHLKDKTAEQASHPGHPHTTQPSRLQDKPILEDLHPGHPHPTPPSQKQSLLQKLFQYGGEKKQKALLPQGAKNGKDRLKDEHKEASKEVTKISNPNKSNKEILSGSNLKEDTNSLIGKEISDLSKSPEMAQKNNDYFDDNKDDYFYEKPNSYIALNAIYVVRKKDDNKNQEPGIEDIKNVTTTNATNHAAPNKYDFRKTERVMKRNINPDHAYFGSSYKSSNDLHAEKDLSEGKSYLDFSKYDKPHLSYFSKSRDSDSENMISNSNIDNSLYNPTNYGNLGRHMNEHTGTNFLNSLDSKSQTGKSILTATNTDNHEKYFDWQNSKPNTEIKTDFLNSMNYKTPSSKSNTENKDFYTSDFENDGIYKNAKTGTNFLSSLNSKSQTDNDILGPNIYSNQDKHMNFEHSKMNDGAEPNPLNVMKLKSKIMKANSEDKDFYPINFKGDNYGNEKTGTDFSSPLNSGSDILHRNIYGKPDRYMDWQEIEPDYSMNSMKLKSQTIKANAENKNDFEIEGSYKNDKMKTDFLNSLISKTQSGSNTGLDSNIYNNQNKQMDLQHSTINEERRFDYLNPMKNEAYKPNTEDKFSDLSNFGNVGSYKNDKIGTNSLNIFDSLDFRSQTANDKTNPAHYNTQEKQTDFQYSAVNEEKEEDFFNSKSPSNKAHNIDEISDTNNLKNKESNARVNKQTGSLDPKRQTGSKTQGLTHKNKEEKINEGTKTEHLKSLNSKPQPRKVKTVDKSSKVLNSKNVDSKEESQIDQKNSSPTGYDNEDNYDDWQYPAENMKTDTDYLSSERKANTANQVGKAAYLSHFESIRNNRNEKTETGSNLKVQVGSDTQNPTHYDDQEKHKDWQETISNKKTVDGFLNSQNLQSSKGNAGDKVNYQNNFENVDNYKNEQTDTNILNPLDFKTQTGSDILNPSDHNKEEKHKDWQPTIANDGTATNYINSLSSKSQSSAAKAVDQISNPTSFGGQKDPHANGLQLRTIVKVDNENATGNSMEALNLDNKEKKFDISEYTDLLAQKNNEVGKDFLKLINYDKFKFGNFKISETNDHSKDDYSKSMETKDQSDYNTYSKPVQNNLEPNHINSQQSATNTNTNTNFDTQKEEFLKPYEYSAYDNVHPSHESQAQTNPNGQSIPHQSYNTPSDLLFTPFNKQPNINYEKTEYEINRNNEEIEKVASVDKNRYPQCMYNPSEKISNSEYSGYDNVHPSHESQVQTNPNGQSIPHQSYNTPSELLFTPFDKQLNINYEKTEYEINRNNEEIEKVASMDKNRYPQCMYNPSEKISNSEYSGYDNVHPSHESQVQTNLHSQSIPHQSYNTPSDLLFTPFDKQPNINYEKTEYEINRNNEEKSSPQQDHPYSKFYSKEKVSGSEISKNNEEKESSIKKKPHPQYYASERILNLYRNKNIQKDSEDYSKKNQDQLHQQEHMSRSFRDSTAESKASRADKKFENPSKLAPEYKQIVQMTVQNVTRSKFPDMVSKIMPNTAHCEFGSY